jgi:hypothetical protein
MAGRDGSGAFHAAMPPGGTRWVGAQIGGAGGAEAIGAAAGWGWG